MATGTRTRDWADVDFYAVLGVAPDATEDDITRAYRRLAKQLHPDSGATRADVERFKDVSSAYAVLGDSRVRRDYDRVRNVTRSVLTAGPTPAFKSPPPARAHDPGRRAGIVVAAGLVTIAAALAVAFATMTLRSDDADERAATVPVRAVRTDVDGEAHVSFVAGGELITVPEPERNEPGVLGSVVNVRYDPDDPRHVIADEDRFARDITLGIVALKLLVGGAVFTAIGARRFRARRRATTAVR